MRLLIVGFISSVHVARYVELLTGTGWDIHLFAARRGELPHPELRAVTVHLWPPCADPGESEVEVVVPPGQVGAGLRDRGRCLAQLIDEIRPDVVHSHELQHGAALARVARDVADPNAPWLVTNWGSDILWYSRDPARVPLIRAILSSCDYYGAECHRDVALARAYGLRGEVVGVWPVAGGIDIEHASTLRVSGPPSKRRAIAVKGGVSDVGQGALAVKAIERCMDLLDGWEVGGYQVHPVCDERLRALEQTGGIRYTKLSAVGARDSAHDDLLALHGRARVSLALNRSDGLSTSFLEALAMGSFPVQSASCCGGELTAPGRGALFVSPVDEDEITAALRRAIVDDRLVDHAAEINSTVVAQHLDRRQIRLRVIDAYERIASDAAVHA